MKTSQIYHGGGKMQRGFGNGNGVLIPLFPLTPYVSNDGEDILYPDAVNPPDRDSWPDTWAGTYIGDTPVRLKYIWSMIHRFATVDEENNFAIRYRVLTADGSKPAAFSPVDGAILATTYWPNMGSTGGFIHWFFGASWSFDLLIPANSAIFAYVYFNGYSIVSGVNSWLYAERTTQPPPPQP